MGMVLISQFVSHFDKFLDIYLKKVCLLVNCINFLLFVFFILFELKFSFFFVSLKLDL